MSIISSGLISSEARDAGSLGDEHASSSSASFTGWMPLEIADDSGSHLGSIEFENCGEGNPLTATQLNEFKVDFCREIKTLKKWSADHAWSGLPAPNLHVVVSDRYRISKSLVPAWSGRRGSMEFPSWRVVARKAAILHELTHVFFPNSNRLLAEGLAIYLQAELGSNPAFPNFGRPLHDVARERTQDMIPEFSRGSAACLDALRLVELDAIATPSPLTLTIGTLFYGEEPRGQAHLYPVAGSFVQHLIEAHGLQHFQALYAHTPLVPLHQDAGRPDRWIEVYGAPLSELEDEWKLMIAGK